MAPSRTFIIAGAGIGGLTAALALVRCGFRVLVLEQSERLDEAGAGIQLAPNASRVLRDLGLAPRLADRLVIPQALSVKDGRTDREIVRMPLGSAAEFHYGSPYWMVHRADLQAALVEAAQAEPGIELRLGARADDFAGHADGLAVQVTHGTRMQEERGAALVGADGLWSKLRTRLGDGSAPQFSGRAAWRTTLPADKAPREFRDPVIHLWLGRNAHLVHYPVRGGTLVNMVAIAPDRTAGKSWSDDGTRDEVLSRFPAESWAPRPREFLARAQHWLKWSLYDRPAARIEGRGPMTLLGDAAHPMLPFLAQGAAMAIEDAAVLARCVRQNPNALAQAMRRYEAERQPRTARVQRAARRTVKIYHQSGPTALARNLAMTAIGGERLRRRYDWIYDWRTA